MFIQVTLVVILQQSGTLTAKNETDQEYDVASIVSDRSFLGDEMAAMCAKLPIYRVKKSTSRRKCYTEYCYYNQMCTVRILKGNS